MHVVFDFIADNLLLWLLLAACSYGFGTSVLKADDQRGKRPLTEREKAHSEFYYNLAAVGLWAGFVLSGLALWIRMVGFFMQ